MEQGKEEFRVLPANALPADEASAAKRYWGSLQHGEFYFPETHWSVFMSQRIVALRPRSVFELGCNVGRNLVSIRDRDSSIRLTGVDVNAEASEMARSMRGLDVIHADDSFIAGLGDDEIDIVFTVSVLDHLTEPARVLNDMVRVARIGVLLLEPYLGREGKVVKNMDPATGELTDSTPYSYSWDYQKLAADLPVTTTVEPYPLSQNRLGPYYRLYQLLKRPAGLR